MQIPPEDEDKVIKVGSREHEVYLSTILNKFSQYDYIYLQVLVYTPLLSKVEEYFQYFRWLGIRRVEKIFDIDIPFKTKEGVIIPNKFIKARVFKWELIPRLINYRNDVVKEEIEEEMGRKVI